MKLGGKKAKSYFDPFAPQLETDTSSKPYRGKAPGRAPKLPKIPKRRVLVFPSKKNPSVLPWLDPDIYVYEPAPHLVSPSNWRVFDFPKRDSTLTVRLFIPWQPVQKGKPQVPFIRIILKETSHSGKGENRRGTYSQHLSASRLLVLLQALHQAYITLQAHNFDVMELAPITAEEATQAATLSRLARMREETEVKREQVKEQRRKVDRLYREVRHKRAEKSVARELRKEELEEGNYSSFLYRVTLLDEND